MDDIETKKKLLDELMSFAKGGMAHEMRSRHGMSAPAEDMGMGMEGAMPEGEPQSEEVPGVEKPEGALSIEAEGEIDPEILQKLLEAVKG